MRIFHHIGFGHRDQVDAILDRLQIPYKKTYGLRPEDYILTFDIYEDDPRWPVVERLVEEKQAVDLFSSEFTPEEVLAAEWVRLLPAYGVGYPQPERDRKYLQRTFAHVCPSCGLKFDQIAPWRIKKEPGLRKYSFMTLHWTHATFARPEVAERILAEGLRGVETRPVVLHGPDRPSERVVELVFPLVAGPALEEPDRVRPEFCPACQMTKFAFHQRGYLHLRREGLRQDTDAQLTYEWFGSNTKTGYREILISQRFARLILEQGWRGVDLWPVELV